MARKKDKEVSKRISKNIGMFDLIPDQCKLCKKAFDKKSKEMAQTWVVNANYDTRKVTIFCPDCWKVIQEQKDNIKEKMKNGKRESDSSIETGNSTKED